MTGRWRICRCWLVLMLLCVFATAAVAEGDAVPFCPDIPTGERVEDIYFEDAVLVGDSMADGFAIHQLLPEVQVMARIGLSPRTARTQPLFKHGGKAVTIVQKLPRMRPSMVYLWLGSNGLTHKTADAVLSDYDRLLRMLVTALPNTPICLIEVTPVAQLSGVQYEGFTNERIDAFNAGLQALAEEHELYLLRVNALLKDEQGLLAEPFQSGDGIHLLKSAYEKLAEHIYTHPLPQRMAEEDMDKSETDRTDAIEESATE